MKQNTRGKLERTDTKYTRKRQIMYLCVLLNSVDRHDHISTFTNTMETMETLDHARSVEYRISNVTLQDNATLC